MIFNLKIRHEKEKEVYRVNTLKNTPGFPVPDVD